MAARQLQASDLVAGCDPASLDLGAADAADVTIVGQERARAAVEFGIAMQHPGYHLFVMGPPGCGKRTLARRAIAEHLARDGLPRFDWVYVNNFAQPHQPIALRLPAGRGARLRADMRQLVDDLRATIPAAFESEEYASALEKLNNEYKERAERALGEVGEEAQRQGLAMIRTPAGFTFAAQKDGDVMSPQDYEALSAEQKAHLAEAVEGLNERLVHVLRDSMRQRKEHADRLRALNRSTTLIAVEHPIEELKGRYTDLPAVGEHIDAVRTSVIENADAFRADEAAEAARQEGALAPYEVNLLVDAGGEDGTPIVEADLPSYQNLVGRVDHVARFGTLLTDFRHIKPGLMHRANGGYLLIDAVQLLTQPFAWNALKRALMRAEVRIEPTVEMFSTISTIQLEPCPIPLALKVVLIGEREICALLQAHDPEFEQLFRVVADLDDDLPRTPAMQRDMARTLLAQAAAKGLLRPDAPALAQLIDHAARRAGDATRVSAGVRRLLDVLHEADHLARRAGRDHLGAEDVAAALAARRARAGRADERMRDATLRGIVAVATAGEHVGQVNGLAAYQIGDEPFGIVTRISATTRLGDGEVIDIQRETQLGGPIHAKGVLILASFLAARYSRFNPHSIVASLVFEQTYGVVEGDSASLAELVSLLSSIADVPVRQCLAVTGSVDQFGTVQAVGGVNEKIEAFFDLCMARGLDGSHGVILPHSNVEHLMLREDVRAALAEGRFAIHAVRSVDDALEVLTGLAAGDAALPSEETVNGRIARRLHEYSTIRRGEPRFMHRRHPQAVSVVARRNGSG
ncbi:MAG TPA: AAA family ATPase [Albitalea sp.]|nr:AAA family ATPase [Albitalea sp.]